ncbi:MAG: hypothetical protein JWM16_5899 [Verrucomicrobiales bacterium]|nr:hypothetical protein [Verrucomicrobiales bacterium]
MSKALIVEQLEADGTLRSFLMQPSSHDGNIVVAFADEYRDSRLGPFHFLDESDEQRFAAGFAKCRARKLGLRNFRSDGRSFHVELAWSGIPTGANFLSYYALSFPQHAIINQLTIRDPQNPTREYLRWVTRDDDRQRYVVYLECTSRLERFDFELVCDFVVDHQGFSAANYADPKPNEGYRCGNVDADLELFLAEGERQKVQQFFIERVIMGDTYSAGQAGAMGPQAHAHDMSFHQVSAQQLGHLDMRSLAVELAALRREMRQKATDPAQDIAIGEIAAAEAAAQKGDASSVMRHLKSAGKWAFDVATKVGVSIASEAIKNSIS